SMPVMDLTLGFHQVAKFYYFPGWHQQATINQLMISKKKWAEFSPTQKAIIQAACDATMLQQYAEGEAIQFQAMKDIEAKGVKLMKWSPEFLRAFEKAWIEVVAEQNAKSPEFKKAWDSYSTFRSNYKVWKDLGYLQ
ncbi:MAG: C4-dicarboxylate ABC transporter, partial [Betaproteobacteria bacterium]|nr:C4-dicarboxylate ABC transporter [Betaproteobacteria bacterium]